LNKIKGTRKIIGNYPVQINLIGQKDLNKNDNEKGMTPQFVLCSVPSVVGFAQNYPGILGKINNLLEGVFII